MVRVKHLFFFVIFAKGGDISNFYGELCECDFLSAQKALNIVIIIDTGVGKTFETFSFANVIFIIISLLYYGTYA